MSNKVLSTEVILDADNIIVELRTYDNGLHTLRFSQFENFHWSGDVEIRLEEFNNVVKLLETKEV